MFKPGLSALMDAAESLGWEGHVVQVRLCGEDAWAVASLEPEGSALADGAAPVSIAGVLVAGSLRSRPTQRASVFAGYCPRAVLVPRGRDLLSLQIDAAILEQGVVVVTEDGARKLSDAGPKVQRREDASASAHHDFAAQVCAKLLANVEATSARLCLAPDPE